MLHRERQARLGVPPAAPEILTNSGISEGYERTALGRLLMRAGDETGALDEFRRAVQNQPQDFWANYYRGRCAYRLAFYDEALNAFCACVALAPNQAECFHNRALTLTALGQLRAALADYDRALQLDPALSAAARNRAALHEQLHSTPNDG